jgi:hypothetical protein
MQRVCLILRNQFAERVAALEGDLPF